MQLTRDLPDGRCIVVHPMIPPNFRLCIGEQDSMVYDDAWCYQDETEAVSAAERWDGHGDPPGRWVRHIATGRRRSYTPDGRLADEWVSD